jgi:hypothetical protein
VVPEARGCNRLTQVGTCPQEFDVVCLGSGVAEEAIAVGERETVECIGNAIVAIAQGSSTDVSSGAHDTSRSC